MLATKQSTLFCLNYVIYALSGYGDSTRIRPTEQGVVEDALAVYGWLHDSLDEQNRPLVVVWGHSLGSFDILLGVLKNSK